MITAGNEGRLIIHLFTEGHRTGSPQDFSLNQILHKLFFFQILHKLNTIRNMHMTNVKHLNIIRKLVPLVLLS